MPALPDGQPNGTSCHQPGIPSRWPCVFIRASPGWSDQSELWPDHEGQKCHPWQLVSGTVSHWDTPGSYLALCVPMLKVSSVSGAGNPVSSSYNSPIIVYNRDRGGSISMDRVRCRPSAGAYPVILSSLSFRLSGECPAAPGAGAQAHSVLECQNRKNKQFKAGEDENRYCMQPSLDCRLSTN